MASLRYQSKFTISSYGRDRYLHIASDRMKNIADLARITTLAKNDVTDLLAAAMPTPK